MLIHVEQFNLDNLKHLTNWNWNSINPFLIVINYPIDQINLLQLKNLDALAIFGYLLWTNWIAKLQIIPQIDFIPSKVVHFSREDTHTPRHPYTHSHLYTDRQIFMPFLITFTSCFLHSLCSWRNINVQHHICWLMHFTFKRNPLSFVINIMFKPNIM